MSQELVFTRSSTTKQVSNNKSKNEEKKITQIERPHDSLYRVKQEAKNKLLAWLKLICAVLKLFARKSMPVQLD